MHKIILLTILAVILSGCATSTSSLPSPSAAGTGAPFPSIATRSENISVNSPSPYEVVGSGFTVIGEARVFENTINFRIVDNADNILQQGYTTADSPDIGQFGPYEIIIESYVPPVTADGKLEVFSESPKDGTEINKVTIPIRFRDR